MSKIKLESNPSGTGTFTIQSPASSTDRTLTLPDEAGTVLTSASDIQSQAMGSVPVFRAYRASSNQSISSVTTTTIILNATEYDSNSDFNTSTGVYTPSVAGYYQFNGMVALSPDGSETGGFIAILYKNSTWTASADGYRSAGSTRFSAHVSDIIYMNGTTDNVTLRTYIAFAKPVIAGSPHTYLSGALVRRA
jgi:hypothetical protein